jgi:hypothetical protein
VDDTIPVRVMPEQMKTWGSSTCVRYFPSVRRFELTSVKDMASATAPSHTLPDSVHQLHVQQPSTYAKPEAASAVLGS